MIDDKVHEYITTFFIFYFFVTFYNRLTIFLEHTHTEDQATHT